jgi:hypothetical protein
VAQAVRSLGVLHVEHQTPPVGKDIVSLKEDISILDKVINILSSPEISDKSGLTTIKLLKDWRFTSKHILDVYARIDHLVEYSSALKAKIEEYRMWGDFDPEAVAKLRGRGIQIKLYLIPAKEIAALSKSYNATIAAIEKGVAYCAITSMKPFELPYREVVLPKMGLNEMKMRLGENEEIVHSLRDALRKYTFARGRFVEIRKAFGRELVLREAINGMGSAGKLAYITGYAPAEKIAALEEFARKTRSPISGMPGIVH